MPALAPLTPLQPGIDRGDETTALVLLRVAAEEPDVAGLVLGDVVERLLGDLAAVDLVIEHQHGANAVDVAVDVGDGRRHLVRHRAAADRVEPSRTDWVPGMSGRYGFRPVAGSPKLAGIEPRGRDVRGSRVGRRTATATAGERGEDGGEDRRRKRRDHESGAQAAVRGTVSWS